MLQVRADWLAFDRGEMTERGEEERQTAESIADEGVATTYRDAQQRRDDFEREGNEALAMAFNRPPAAFFFRRCSAAMD